MRLFWRTQLRSDEEFIDNSDETIANELRLSLSQVSNVIRKVLKKRWEDILEQRAFKEIINK